MQYKNTSGFSIVLAMGLALVLSFTSLYLLEYMIPFSKNIKGVENASQAFYEGYSGVEDALLKVYSGSVGEPHSDIFSTSLPQDFGYSVEASGDIIPVNGKGNSEFDINWNRLSQEEPISLLIGEGRLNSGGANKIQLFFRVPDLDGLGGFDEGLYGSGEDFLIWQLTSLSGSLTVASGSLISENNINGSAIYLWGESGTPLIGANENFSNFYSRDCNNLGKECVLKVSVINPLKDNSGISIPYLEYQIVINSGENIPLSHSYISVSGKSYGFTKKLEASVPQQSTSSAFDFTVLQ